MDLGAQTEAFFLTLEITCGGTMTGKVSPWASVTLTSSSPGRSPLNSGALSAFRPPQFQVTLQSSDDHTLRNSVAFLLQMVSLLLSCHPGEGTVTFLNPISHSGPCLAFRQKTKLRLIGTVQDSRLLFSSALLCCKRLLSRRPAFQEWHFGTTVAYLTRFQQSSCAISNSVRVLGSMPRHPFHIYIFEEKCDGSRTLQLLGPCAVPCPRWNYVFSV
ncbi:hypothetical protein SISSUDRAFT_814928 [Sistotremastrum suecicum HHB10207 ss-3]|uniref:Uncharacterized protein n=1 Tax=Sistotremastrum suecicum HHB10207 ss-3 TaxID=1314776 RepID=A0A166CU91_9AGAM|nr:hypothetical protein SISSUDRAFT_814928 [Sistotremastrum suecicum HHB10207 ss-3]